MVDEEEFSPTTRSVVVARLREEILSGRTPYGTRLRQADVAARFGISTTPVREAFRELATLGLVEIQAHRGAIVLRPSADELAHIYQVRTLLEPVSVAWSAQQMTEGDLDDAWKLIELMRDPTTPDAAATLNRRFHALIAGACGNQHLGELVINLLDLSTPYIVRVLESSQERTERQTSEHEEILQACADGDPRRAYQASLVHLTRLHLKPGEGDGQPLMSTIATRWLPFDLPAWLDGSGPPPDGKQKPKPRRKA
jgi:DNA-binding GntR family transcriptional regulator